MKQGPWKMTLQYYLLTLLPVVLAQCPAPIELPLKQVQVLSNISNSYMFGISATVGTPAQNIVLLPWPELNNTWIYDQQRYCDKSVIPTEASCVVRRGNSFLEDDSSSFVQKTSINSAGGASQEGTYTGQEFGISKLPSLSIAGSDTFNLAGSGDLKQFPIGIPRAAWDGGYTTLHALGLGMNSTYLNSLKASGRIVRKVWSIYWGRMWTQSNPIDGSLIIGGYDAKKVTGRNYTGKLDYGSYGTSTGCWTGMRVDIADIKVSMPGGTDRSIMTGNTVLPMCIVPQRQVLAEIPAATYHQFEVVTGTTNLNRSYGFHWSGYSFPKNKVFGGDITFRFGTGFEVRIPNDQYVVDHVDFDQNGARIGNDSLRDVVLNAIDKQPVTLGRYFFTSAVLMVDQEAGTFTIWQANPTSAKNIVPVLGSTSEFVCASNGTSASNSTNSSPLPSSEGSRLPLAAIIGIVVGAVVLFVIAAFVMFYLWRRRRAQVAQGSAATKGGLNPEYFRPDKPQELHSTDLPITRYEAGGKEMRKTTAQPEKKSYFDASGAPERVYEMDGNSTLDSQKKTQSTPLLNNWI